MSQKQNPSMAPTRGRDLTSVALLLEEQGVDASHQAP